MADLDFVVLVGRLGLVVADGIDADNTADIIWCDSGTVTLTPSQNVTKIAGGSPSPWTGGQSAVSLAVDSEGYLTWAGKRYISFVDLTSSKVNPVIPTGKATHSVRYDKVKSGDMTVAFPNTTIRLAADQVKAVDTQEWADALGLPLGTMVCDLTKATPVPTASGTPIVVGPSGPAGTSVESLAVDAGSLTYTLSDGSTGTAGALPTGDAITDSTLSSLLAPGSGSEAAGAVTDTIASKVRPADSLRAFGHSYVSGVIGTGTGAYSQTFVPTLGELLGLPVRNDGYGGSSLYAGDPAVAVLQNVTRPPYSRFVPANGLGLIMWGLNDLNKVGNTVAALAVFKEALRVVVSRLRSGAIYEDDHGSVTYGGVWTNLANTARNSGASLHYTTANGATVTVTTPDEFPGGTLALGFSSWADNGGGILTGTVNGQQYSIDTRPATATGLTSVKVLRIPNVPAGSHAYTFTTSDISGGVGVIFDYWAWEPDADDGPLVVLVKQPKPLDYTAYGSVAPGPPTDAGVDALNTVTDTVAAEYGGRVVTVDLSDMDKSAAYFVAGNVHPTIEGHRHMAEKIATVVKPLIVPRPAPQWQQPRVEWGTAAPSGPTRLFHVGDRIMNTAPAETGATAGSKYVTLGWVCTADGSPGTWVPMRVLTGN